MLTFTLNMTKRTPALQQFPLSAHLVFLDPDAHTKRHIATLTFTVHMQACLISGSHHIWIIEKLMVDRGQAPPDWLASFKKTRSAEKTAQHTRWVASPSIRSQYLVDSFELNRVKKALQHPGHRIHFPSTPSHTCIYVFVFTSLPFSLCLTLSAFYVGHHRLPAEVCIYIKSGTMYFFRGMKIIEGRGVPLPLN